MVTESWNFDCELNIAEHKTIKGKIDLRISIQEDDEYAKEEDTTEYLDGIRIEGELIVDVPFGNNIITAGKTGEIRVFSNNQASCFSVVFVEMTNVIVIVPNKIKRYFWLVYGIGKPIYDVIGLFPPNWGKPTLKVFIVKDVVGRWSNAAALIVAKDRTEAKKLLDQELLLEGLDKHNQYYTLEEVDLKTSKVSILCNS